MLWICQIVLIIDNWHFKQSAKTMITKVNVARPNSVSIRMMGHVNKISAGFISLLNADAQHTSIPQARVENVRGSVESYSLELRALR